MRILLKQNTALLSTFRMSDTGMTSQLFLIIWWFRVWKPYVFYKHIIQVGRPDHSYYLTTWPPDHLTTWPSDLLTTWTTLTSLITWTIWPPWPPSPPWPLGPPEPIESLWKKKRLIKQFIKINAEFALFTWSCYFIFFVFHFVFCICQNVRLSLSSTNEIANHQTEYNVGPVSRTFHVVLFFRNILKGKS